VPSGYLLVTRSKDIKVLLTRAACEASIVPGRADAVNLRP
jgi:hypothetical protein